MSMFNKHFNTVWGDFHGVWCRYMTRVVVGQHRLHLFYRGDGDEDPHDHPFSFRTFPFMSYVEEVTVCGPTSFTQKRQVVEAFRWHHREASHTHRVLGRWTGRSWSDPQIEPGIVITYVITGKERQHWGFLKTRFGRTCFVPWRRYVFEGGKTAPCSD